MLAMINFFNCYSNA